MSSRGSRDVFLNNRFKNIARNAGFPVRKWKDRSVGCFLTKMENKLFFLKKCFKI